MSSAPQSTSPTAPAPLNDRMDAESFRSIIDALPDGVVLVDRDWTFTFANPRAQELVGGEDFTGANLWERYPGNNEEPFNTAYRTTMRDRTPREFEAFHPTIERWLKVRSRPHGDDGIIIFFNDVTARKEAQLLAATASRELAQAMDATSDAILSLDREWRMTFANGNAMDIIDPEGRGALGKNFWEWFPLAAVPGLFRDNYHATMDEGVTRTFEAYYAEPIDRWFAIQSRPSPDGIVLFFRDITAQREREQTVLAQTELLTVVQRAARSASWELDATAGTLTYGPGSFDVLGGVGKPIDTLAKLAAMMLPGHAERLQTAVQDALVNRSALTVEFAVNTPGGQAVWVEARGEALADAPHLLRGMLIDVTKRKQDEASLLASTERYRVLADLNPQALWAGDPEGNIIYANQGFLAYIGLTAENLNGEGWLEAFTPSDRDRVVRIWTHSVTTGEDYEIEALIRHAESGQDRYWKLRAAPIRDAAGAIVQWLGIGEDIHVAKTAAAALRSEQIETERRRAELETIYTTSPVSLALLDPFEFRFLNLNDHEAAMLGLPRDQILGRPLEEIAPAATMPGLKAIMDAVVRGETIRDHLVEGELATQPGEKRAWSVNYSPIFAEDGTVRAISTASVEITNQKKAEAALVQSEKLAAVGRLASSISHEINNPLEAITNLLYLIANDTTLPPELKIYVSMAQSELSRVSQIATQTLRFHRQAVNPTPVTAAELVGAVVRLYTGRLANSNIKVDARYATTTKILCFENDIRQVLNNLIANAIDAMRNGGQLIIRAHEAHIASPHDDGPHVDSPQVDGPQASCIAGVRITVADTGHGMTPEVVARIFEPFYTTKDLNGTGLGLWISSGIVDRHQGRLSVRSSVHERHHGTVFALFLPRKEVTTL